MSDEGLDFVHGVRRFPARNLLAALLVAAALFLLWQHRPHLTGTGPLLLLVLLCPLLHLFMHGGHGHGHGRHGDDGTHGGDHGSHRH